jgi:O-antigen/teichoic acid export membrane protein
MHKPLEIKGSLLACNTALNFIGQVLPLLVGVATIPFIVRGLGTERFGLLSLAWVVLGYFAIFDLGLGRATTKFVAEALGKGEEEQVPRLVWTAITIQAVLGVVGALVLFGITPLLVEHILNIPRELIGKAKATFYLLAFSIPVVLVSSSFQGTLEAAQRFDLVNAVRIPSSILTFLLPLVGLLLGFNLPGIVVLILLVRVGALLTFVIMNLRITPQLRRYSGSFALFPRLFSFGGWVTVSSIVGPILVYKENNFVINEGIHAEERHHCLQ